MSRNLNKKISNELEIGPLANNLCNLMHRMKIDANQLSKQTGIALTTINGLKRGVGNPTLSTLYQLADFFCVSIGQLTESDISENMDVSGSIHNIPLLSFDDLSIYLIDNTKYKNTIATEIESRKPNNYFATKVNNNSMSPLFEKGTIFVLSQSMNAYDGDIVLVKFENQYPCFRRVFIEGSTFFFKPVTESINDTVTKNSEFIIQGIVIKAIQHFHG